MHIREGIRVIDYSPAHNEPRLWLNSGTVQAGEDFPLPNYDPLAFVPKLDWREPNSEEKDILIASKPKDSGEWISIVKIPDLILERFIDITEASQEQKISKIKDLVESQKFTGDIKFVKEFVSTFHTRPDKPLEGGFIFVGGPNKLTLTFAPGPRYIGLHIDSFYQVPLGERKLSPNRICINLGAGNRYLFFLNIPVLEIANVLNKTNIDVSGISSGSPLGHLFLKTFPDYPIIKIRIGPGEAYIAPTENMVHEGSSLGNKFYDSHLTIRGHFTHDMQPPEIH